jgi:hypothetical protein
VTANCPGIVPAEALSTSGAARAATDRLGVWVRQASSSRAGLRTGSMLSHAHPACAFTHSMSINSGIHARKYLAARVTTAAVPALVMRTKTPWQGVHVKRVGPWDGPQVNAMIPACSKVADSRTWFFVSNIPGDPPHRCY